MSENQQAKGVLIAVAAIFILSPDGLLVRLIGGDNWTILFWRGLLSGLAIAAAITVLKRQNPIKQILDLGPVGWGAAALFVGNTVFFVTSIQLTKVANTLFILGTMPVFAAVFAWLFLREPVADAN